VKDKQRIRRILNKLKIQWERHPDQRLGQLLLECVFIQGKKGDKTSIMFYQEDDVSEKLLDSILAEPYVVTELVLCRDLSPSCLMKHNLRANGFCKVTTTKVLGKPDKVKVEMVKGIPLEYFKEVFSSVKRGNGTAKKK